MIEHLPWMAALARQEEKDRKELVQPPPSGWKPGAERRKLKLTLMPEKTIIRKGESLRYRLEARNIGREDIGFYEPFSAFVKSGDLYGPHSYRFYVTPPGGKKERMGRPILPSTGFIQEEEISFPDTMSAAGKDAAFEKMKMEDRIERGLSLALRSGETLITRPDPKTGSPFRELWTDFQFKKAGAYRIRVVYENLPPDPPTQHHIQGMIGRGHTPEEQKKFHDKMVRNSLGLVESNEVILEVAP
ncbi:MAG: hypothetical protein AAB412_00310 [Elusimicrobiota bacterium]